jgi:hypothetical protein
MFERSRESILMKPRFFCLGIVATATALLTLNPMVRAQNNRTFVSGQGADTNPCALTTPCRTFQHAHDLTNPGGEITILSPAGYGPVSITKSISIVNDGVGEAGVTAPTGDAIDINVGPADVVNLRGLTLVGPGPNFTSSTSGVSLNTGGTLNVQNCSIRQFIFAIQVNAAGSNLNVQDTNILGGNSGISSTTSTGFFLFLNRVTIADPQYGIFLNSNASTPGITGIIANSSVIGAGQVGYLVSGANLLIINSSFIGGTLSAIFETASGAAYVGGSVLNGSNNTAAFAGAHNHSYGNNSIIGGVGNAPASVATR